jgi:hypothetical protein
MANVPSHTRTRRTHRRTMSAMEGSSSLRKHGFSDFYGGGVSGAEEVYDQIAIDEAGQITAGQISPGAVTGAAFASTIAPVILVHGLPTLPDPNYPVDVFVYDIDAVPKRLYKNVADVWTAAIGPDDIQANSITAGQIAAGAIATSELAVSLVLPGSLANEAGGTPGVFIDSTGILIRSGKLTLQDEFGETTMDASGFSGSWSDFVATGFYNGAFRAGTAGALSNGRLAALPYWTVAADGATAATLTFLDPGLRYSFTAQTDGRKITSDQTPVLPGQSYSFELAYEVARSAGDVVFDVRVHFYDASGAFSSTVTSLLHHTASQPFTVWTLPLAAGADEYFAAFEFRAAQTVHNAANTVTLWNVRLAEIPIEVGDLQVAELAVSGSLIVDVDVDVAGTLEVEGDFEVGAVADRKFSVDSATGRITQYENNSWTAYTPVVGGDGTATYSTAEGYYMKIGKIVFVEIYLVCSANGTGASNITITTPTEPDRNVRQVITGNSEGHGVAGVVQLVALLGGSGDVWDRVRSSTGVNLIGTDIDSGGILTFTGWYREV